MTSAAILVDRLSKCYEIASVRSQRKSTLLAHLGQWASDPIRILHQRFRAKDAPVRPRTGVHWALSDVSFSVPEGQVVGIIGHNGAGKSTLLKILSRVTHPSSGSARIRGRMASLLEVGTGFHPELSGRDNVRMNAAILGMSAADIRRRFDEIVAFSGVDQFIDTPIKRYSSGMKVRLAFAVAAHLDPEILVIDEVLAVGDAAFQKKCLSRVEEVGSSGRTVLFVSHQLTTVARLCSRTLVLDHGKVAFDGQTLDALHFYNAHIGDIRSRRDWPTEIAPGNKIARLQSVEVLDEGRSLSGPVDVRRRVGIRMRYSILEGGYKVMPSVHLFDGGGTWIFSAVDLDKEWHNRPRPAGDYESTAWIPSNYLNDIAYTVSVALGNQDPFQTYCFVHDCASFSIYDPGEPGTARGAFSGEMQGLTRPVLDWETRRV